MTHGAAGLFLDPGLGKTSIVCSALTFLKEKHLFTRAFVIAPLRVCHLVWPEEVAKWRFPLRVHVLHGTGRDLDAAREADVVCINPEGLPWLAEQGRWRRLGCDVLIVDESTKFKNTRAKRFQILRPHLAAYRRRIILTGSPSPNGLLDLFGQVQILDGGAALGRYITQYRNAYFYPTGYGGYQWSPQPDAQERIQERIAPLVLRLAAEDYIDMPERIDVDVLVDLPPAARRIYDELEREFLTEVDGDLITAPSVATAGVKLRQIANGAVYTSTPAWKAVHDAKLDALRDLVEELQGQPALILYEFQHDRDRIVEMFGPLPTLGGQTTTAQAKAAVEGWNLGRVPLLLGHPASMGHGLNLQGAGRHVIWFGLTWDFDQYDQAIRRVWRSGNVHRQVIVHHILAADSVEQAVARALQAKARSQGSLLEALREYARR